MSDHDILSCETLTELEANKLNAALCYSLADAPNTISWGDGHGIVTVLSTNTYRPAIYQRTTSDGSNVPLLTTNSFMVFRRISP